jgi:DNA-binding MarR family transcriptional regulator
LKVDAQDRRSRRITLTAAGRKKLAESKALWARAQQRFESAYGAQKAAGLRKLLGEIYADDFSAAFAAAL